MKRFISLLLICMLAVSALAVSPVYTFAEEVGDEVIDGNTSTDDNPSDENVNPEGDSDEGGEGNVTPEGDANTTPEDNTTDGTEDGEGAEGGADVEENTDPIGGFLAQYLPVEALGKLKDALFGFVGQLWAFIQRDETYSNIATAILAVLTLIAIPIIIGVVVVIYAVIGAMIIFAGALTAVIEIVLSMIPSIV